MILLDIPKPKRCLYCPMIDYTHDVCIVRPTHAGEQISQLEERPSWCSIVEEYDCEALEKAKPKKPIKGCIAYQYAPSITTEQCPNCKRRIRTGRAGACDAYCPTCGQAIDRNEEEKEGEEK